MTDEQWNLICDYMDLKLDNNYYIDKRRVCHFLNDGNDMVIAMNIINHKEEWENFFDYVKNRCDCPCETDTIPWLMQPENFFKLMGVWLEVYK